VEETHFSVSLTSFCLPALSIGTFHSQELGNLFHRNSFFPLYYSILLFFFKLNRKRKFFFFSKKSGNGTIFPFYCWQLESVMLPLNKALKTKSPSYGRDLVWLRYALTLLLSQLSLDWLSLPIIWRVRSCLLPNELIQSHHMLPYSHIESFFCSREVILSWPLCGVSWLNFSWPFLVFSIMSIITSIILVLYSCWFEKVPIEFLLASLVLINDDILL